MTKRDRLELVGEMIEWSVAAGDPLDEILSVVAETLGVGRLFVFAREQGKTLEVKQVE